jgi:uncharacterized protein involved in response to NO
MVVLVASGLWWAVVQLQRSGAPVPLPYAVSPSLTHAAVMAFGFIPLFFAGFLFTAGPRWLGMPQPSAPDVAPALFAQCTGWLLWLAGAHAQLSVALTGLALATGGLAAVTLRFWRLVMASPAPDRLHAKTIAASLTIGCTCVAGFGLALALDAPEIGRALLLTGLWGFVVVVYVAVAHRMIPFFTSSALPLVQAWRPGWVLGLMLGMAAFEALAVWMELGFGAAPPWLALRGALELAAGGVLLWLAVAWGLVQSLKIRLLAMLHLGFLWLGLALALGGVANIIGALADATVLPLAPLHALTMGCLGSLMLAMVTRVSCGHSGRPLVADNLVWALFWLLQAAVLVRIAAAVPGLAAQWWLTAAALVWAAAMTIWGIRYGNWYGRPRADGRPG